MPKLGRNFLGRPSTGRGAAVSGKDSDNFERFLRNFGLHFFLIIYFLLREIAPAEPESAIPILLFLLKNAGLPKAWKILAEKVA